MIADNSDPRSSRLTPEMLPLMPLLLLLLRVPSLVSDVECHWCGTMTVGTNSAVLSTAVKVCSIIQPIETMSVEKRRAYSEHALRKPRPHGHAFTSAVSDAPPRMLSTGRQ